MIKLIAHRGNDKYSYDENSKDAILNALNKDYIYGVEFDIRITKDKKFVIHHNSTINLSSNGSGFIKNKTLKELKKLKFGKNKYKISTLDELLKAIKNINSKKIILIEIKEEFNYSKKELIKLVLILKKYKSLNIYICSFNYKLLLKLKKYLNFKMGLIISRIINSNKDVSLFDFLSIHSNIYQKYKDFKEIMVWTINTIEELKKIDNKDYIITDKAYKLAKYNNPH